MTTNDATDPLQAIRSNHPVRGWLSRAGNRRMNHMLHIAAITQIRLDTDGRAYGTGHGVGLGPLALTVIRGG
jgi:hypothetical protein